MTKKLNQTAYYKSPIGWLKIDGDGNEIVAVNFVTKPRIRVTKDPLLQRALIEIHEYFNGKRERFTLKLRFTGTSFQQKVWSKLCKINCGDKASYRTIAALAGRPQAFRAAANAISRNRMAVLVPCHRVVASGGAISGYSGGVWRKKWLLEHEAKFKLRKARGAQRS